LWCGAVNTMVGKNIQRFSGLKTADSKSSQCIYAAKRNECKFVSMYLP